MSLSSTETLTMESALDDGEYFHDSVRWVEIPREVGFRK